ncbi:hypothetical protein M433DRAFT_164825 [Acidomyces richmondensis BFW]|nr:MAG: hypothetical protein FE78DRAFT_88410 [Acidomyces sp. 'richmondensis']KYG46898.1 hypothetical protein M433DRAFT_164825 [Acidomyces richmondensis BFW]
MEGNPEKFSGEVKIPRIAIRYCTQCRWMLRAAYFSQELLSTFGTSIGEIALLPTTGGTFTVHLCYRDSAGETRQVVLWDRKVEGGFPETKILKQRLRNHIDPGKSLGHSDTPPSRTKGEETASGAVQGSTDPFSRSVDSMGQNESVQICEDCK